LQSGGIIHDYCTVYMLLGTKDSWLPSPSWWPANRNHSETCPWCTDMVSEITTCLVFNYIKRANQVLLHMCGIYNLCFLCFDAVCWVSGRTFDP